MYSKLCKSRRFPPASGYKRTTEVVARSSSKNFIFCPKDVVIVPLSYSPSQRGSRCIGIAPARERVPSLRWVAVGYTDHHDRLANWSRNSPSLMASVRLVHNLYHHGLAHAGKFSLILASDILLRLRLHDLTFKPLADVAFQRKMCHVSCTTFNLDDPYKPRREKKKKKRTSTHTRKISLYNGFYK